jgi:hypothetical protein
MVMTVICVKEVHLSAGRDVPCSLSNGMAAVAVIWMPGMMLCRSLHLWYAFIIRDFIKPSRDGMHWRFRTLLSWLLLALTLAAILVATSGKVLCNSDMYVMMQCASKESQGAGRYSQASLIVD